MRWYCIGEGNSRKEYESTIKDNKLEKDFILLGSISNPYPYIKCSDIYVQTSRHEGYCLTLAEAKCLCKPIVTTNFIGAYEQIEDGINGFIVVPDEDDIYKNIKYIIDNKEISDSFIEKLKIEQMDKRENVNKLMSFID